MAVDANRDPRTVLRALRLHPREADHRAESLADPRARHATRRPPVLDDLRAFLRQRPVRNREADEPLLDPALLDEFDSPLADEVVLLLLDDPRHAGRQEIRLGVGVLADDHVRLLEAQHALGLEPERDRALRNQSVPQMFRSTRRAVQLVPELADKADPQRETR